MRTVIDIEKLVEALTNQWFEEYTKGMNPKDLYDTYLYEGYGMHIIDEIKSEYANIYWNRYDFYRELILEHETD